MTLVYKGVGVEKKRASEKSHHTSARGGRHDAIQRALVREKRRRGGGDEGTGQGEEAGPGGGVGLHSGSAVRRARCMSMLPLEPSLPLPVKIPCPTHALPPFPDLPRSIPHKTHFQRLRSVVLSSSKACRRPIVDPYTCHAQG